ncbi:TFIIH complex cyclin Mcs2 [Schizosaccharomyces cryophilus OY26]|uniref:TFIIH complex cyclin Mcs2 n=1 Tax=Schizosaccharomyces cryophilus (strain OY26 / ATCC MYA-4695 / CBS 11777 / NBRC 106824 / NRRL Y48691) TaxID=653667 RepID=S9W2G8_SCHCR|nr:TFIIH complex cyclin Mcs2 [Schizosaccharomyces cryophilus OY26]EPY54228.1 TFIIH complex cyclin Mcs2 [Schizosaccharomyces cryophilus OY26]
MAEDRFRQSSHFRDWIFTEDELQKRRTQINQEFTKVVRQRLLEDLALQNKDASDSNLPPTLDQNEELELVNYYTYQLNVLSSTMSLPTHIRAAATLFFKRFYLTNSVMEYNPKIISFTTLYLATKTNDHYIPIEHFCKNLPKTTPDQVLEYEFNVCQALNWDLFIWLPFRPLQGFLLDFQVVIPETPMETLFECHDQSKRFLVETLHSDVYFFYSPSIIALSGIYHTNPSLCLNYLQAKSINSIHDLIISISNSLDSTKNAKLDREKAKDYGKKLYFCMDPLKKKNSTLYLKRKAEDEEASLGNKKQKSSTPADQLDVNPFA